MSIKTKFGSATISKDGYYIISSSKEGNRGKPLHRLIYEDYYDIKIPKDFIIHHLDGNKVNNDIENLRMMTSHEHMSLHNKGNKYSVGRKLSDETKQKIGKSMEGFKHSEETRRKMSESRKGKNNPFYGKHHSKETITKIIEQQKGEKSCMWKSYARIIKHGFNNGNQVFGLKFNGKMLKTSYHKNKLIDWFLINYPLEIIKI